MSSSGDLVTVDTVRDQLAKFGYGDVPDSILAEFVQELRAPVGHGKENAAAGKGLFAHERGGVRGPPRSAHGTAPHPRQGLRYHEKTAQPAPRPVERRAPHSRVARIPSASTVSHSRHARVAHTFERYSDGEDDGEDYGSCESFEGGAGDGRGDRAAESSRSRGGGGASRGPRTGAASSGHGPSFIRTDLSGVSRPAGFRKHDPVSRRAFYASAWRSDRFLTGRGKGPAVAANRGDVGAPVEGSRRPVSARGGRRNGPAVNDYVPPTDKRRDNLRWAVRTRMLDATGKYA